MPPVQPVSTPSTITKPQKSTLWLWTTLWLTAMFDALLINIVFGITLAFIGKSMVPLWSFVTLVIPTVIAVGCGSYLAAHFVLKRSIIEKSRAHTLALYAIAIPTVVPILLSWTVVTGGQGAITGAIGLDGLVVLCSAIMYGIIRGYIERKGD